MKRKRPFLMRMALAFFMTLFSLWSWGQITESFETGLPSSYNPTLQNATLGTGTWQIKDVIPGTSGVQTGTKSAQVRSATGAQIITPTLTGGVGDISFYVTASTASGGYQVNLSSDNGMTWIPAVGSPFTISTTKTLRTITVNNENVNKVQIYRTGATIYVDDINISAFSSTSPSLSLIGTPLNHGTTCIGSSSITVTYSITNNGTVDATNVQVASDNSQFVVSNYTAQTIAANGGTASFDVTFTPTASGVQNATISVTTSTTGSNSPTLALTGTGTATVDGTVTTAAESNLGSTTVRLNGNLTTLGTCPNTTEKGFVWGSNADPTIADLNTSVTGLSTGAYNYDLTTGLTPNTTYHYRAYIKDANNVYTYGADEVFTTMAVADRLAFVNVPAGGFVNSNLATFTVEARTALNAVDAGYVGSVTISKASGTGAISGTLTRPFVNGVATFNDIKFDAIDTYSLYADHGTFAQITSGTIDIVSVPPFSMIEEFDYPAGALLGQGGWGVTGTNASPAMNVVTSAINYPGYLSSGVGNAVALPASGQDLNKTFTAQTSGSIYTSFLVNVTSASTGGDYFFNLGPNPMSTTFRGRVFVKSVTGGIQFGISNALTAVYGPAVYDLNTTYLLVLKYDINSTAVDAAKIYVNPVLNAAEPLAGWVLSNDASTQASIGALGLRQGGASAPNLVVDGIRVANNWSDLVGTINTTWNGSVWTNGIPTSSLPAVIAGNYSGQAFESQSLTVDAGATLTVSDYIKTGNVTNNGNIIVANNANFVQTGTFTAGGSSSFKLRKDSKAVKRQAYIDWSSPMEGSGQTLKGFSYGKLADGVTNQSVSGTLDNRFYTYNNNAFVATPATGTFVAGQGYQIRTPNDFTTAPQVFHGQFEGTKPNSGTVNYDHSAITGDYVLLGNPYPGAISVADFLTANPGTTETIYSWNSLTEMDANSQYTGINYNTYAPGTGAVPAGSMDGNIPVAQGFFVARGTAASPFVFNDGMRQTSEDGIFSKSAAADRFWLEMNSPSGAKPQMLLAFNAAAGEGYDKGFDAKMFSSNTDVLYSTVDGQSLIIDSHGVFDTSDAFALNANFSTAGNYTISVLQEEGRFSSSQKIYLKDNVTGAVTDISSGTYTFTATAGVQENRFTVQFRPGGVLATDTAVKSGTAIFSSGKEIHVKADGKIASVEVYDMSGKRIAVNSPFETKTVMSVSHTGTVVVKVSLHNGTVQTKKLMIK